MHLSGEFVKRTVSETRVGSNLVRYKIRIEDDPSKPGWDAGNRLMQFMATLINAPDLLNCGYSKPQKMSFYHSGDGWVAEGEATMEETA